MSLSDLPTTDARIAINNLEGSIHEADRLIAMKLRPADQKAAQVELLATRGKYLGRIADYERAAELADALMRDPTQRNSEQSSGAAYLRRAAVRSIFHRFPEALRDLDQAVKLRVPAEGADSLRASILQAQGHYDDALLLRQKLRQKHTHIETLGSEAALLASIGDVARAEPLFLRAQDGYRDVSPFPVAWLYFQQGLMYESAGRFARARDFFSAAHERLPTYAQAAAHLAAVLWQTGDHEAPVKLLWPLCQSSDDPEYAGQLAGYLRQTGHADEADRLRAVARTRYEDLLARHPEAFAAHAARFYLADGSDAKRALVLARDNLARTRSAEAYDLAIEAALAAPETRKLACEFADQAAALAARPAHLHLIAAKAYSACGQQDKASDELAQVGAMPASGSAERLARP